jgi:hypothetical protein
MKWNLKLLSSNTTKQLNVSKNIKNKMPYIHIDYTNYSEEDQEHVDMIGMKQPDEVQNYNKSHKKWALRSLFDRNNERDDDDYKFLNRLSVVQLDMYLSFYDIDDKYDLYDFNVTNLIGEPLPYFRATNWRRLGLIGVREVIVEETEDVEIVEDEECMICYEDKPILQFYTGKVCGHVICNTCKIRGHISICPYCRNEEF